MAKRKGTNAITVSDRVLERARRAPSGVLPPQTFNITVTRNYGETAKEKSNELLYHLLIA